MLCCIIHQVFPLSKRREGYGGHSPVVANLGILAAVGCDYRKLSKVHITGTGSLLSEIDVGEEIPGILSFGKNNPK